MNTDHYLVFDIETRPLPVKVIKERGLLPAFKPRAKDPEKIKVAEAGHEAKCLDEAALDEVTSTVCAVGILTYVGEPKASFGSEQELLINLWGDLANVIDARGMIIGFDIKRFDLPFCFRRSWALGIKPLAALRNDRFWTHHVIDLAEMWKLGNYQEHISLDRLCKLLGIQGKTATGKNFHKLLDSNPEAAREYLIGDLTRPLECAKRMGVIP